MGKEWIKITMNNRLVYEVKVDIDEFFDSVKTLRFIEIEHDLWIQVSAISEIDTDPK